MSKKFKGKLCVYCGTGESETADHVVAREFFPETHRDGLPKVPACKACNAAKAALEKNAAENEFFAEVWQSQKDLAEVAVPFWAGAQTSNANLGKAFADTLK